MILCYIWCVKCLLVCFMNVVVVLMSDDVAIIILVFSMFYFCVRDFIKQAFFDLRVFILRYVFFVRLIVHSMVCL